MTAVKCIEQDCDELTHNEHGRCHDCDIAYLLNCMTCANCGRMRYLAASTLGAYLWGERCACPDGTPSRESQR